jgi:hypothetical protein
MLYFSHTILILVVIFWNLKLRHLLPWWAQTRWRFLSVINDSLFLRGALSCGSLGIFMLLLLLSGITFHSWTKCLSCWRGEKSLFGLLNFICSILKLLKYLLRLIIRKDFVSTIIAVEWSLPVLANIAELVLLYLLFELITLIMSFYHLFGWCIAYLMFCLRRDTALTLIIWYWIDFIILVLITYLTLYIFATRHWLIY